MWQIRSYLRIWSHLLKESLMENFIFVHCTGKQVLTPIPINEAKSYILENVRRKIRFQPILTTTLFKRSPIPRTFLNATRYYANDKISGYSILSRLFKVAIFKAFLRTYIRWEGHYICPKHSFSYQLKWFNSIQRHTILAELASDLEQNTRLKFGPYVSNATKNFQTKPCPLLTRNAQS